MLLSPLNLVALCNSTKLIRKRSEKWRWKNLHRNWSEIPFPVPTADQRRVSFSHILSESNSLKQSVLCCNFWSLPFYLAAIWKSSTKRNQEKSKIFVEILGEENLGSFDLVRDVEQLSSRKRNPAAAALSRDDMKPQIRWWTRPNNQFTLLNGA